MVGTVKLPLLVRLVSLIVLGVLILAAPVMAIASYSATYVVTNNSTTASYSMLPVIGTSNNTYLSSNGFINPSANDTRVQTLGGLEKPWMIADTKTLTVIPVAASSQNNLYFTTGNTPASAMNIITGYGGYITTTANATLEPSANFSIEFPGYFNGGTLWSKASSIVATHDNTTANVTVTVTGTAGLSAILAPNGLGDVTNNILFGAPSNWQTQLTDDGDTSYVYNPNTSDLEDTYAMEDGTIPSYAVIDSVIVHAVIKGVVDWVNTKFQLVVRLGGVDVATVQTATGGGGAYVEQGAALARPGGGSWTVTDIPNLQAGTILRGYAAGGGSARCTQVYVVVAYHYPNSVVTVTGVSPGYYSTANVTADGTNLSLTVGTTTSTVTLYNAAPTGSNWVWGAGNSVPYWNRIKLYTGGNLVLWYEPNTIVNGTTMPNRSGSSAQDGVITWGANPTGVQVALGSMISAAQPAPRQTTSAPTIDMLPETPVSDQFVDPEVAGALLTNPLRLFVRILVTSTGNGMSESQAWTYLGFVFVILVTVGTASQVRGHWIIAGIACAGSIIALVTQTIWPMWTVTFAIVAIIGGAVAERSPSL